MQLAEGGAVSERADGSQSLEHETTGDDLMRVRIITATVASLVAFSAVAMAADQTIQSNELRASKIIGSSVYDKNNEKIGSVQDIILGTGAKVDSVVVDVGTFLGMGGKDVALKMSDIKTDNDRLTTDMSKDQLKQAPSFQLTNNATGAGQTASAPQGGNAANPH
jgi:sporulation protein YlmC with PRC-barrel domain